MKKKNKITQTKISNKVNAKGYLGPLSIKYVNLIGL